MTYFFYAQHFEVIDTAPKKDLQTVKNHLSQWLCNRVLLNRIKNRWHMGVVVESILILFMVLDNSYLINNRCHIPVKIFRIKILHIHIHLHYYSHNLIHYCHSHHLTSFFHVIPIRCIPP
jgi:hypothetical protein